MKQVSPIVTHNNSERFSSISIGCIQHVHRVSWTTNDTSLSKRKGNRFCLQHCQLKRESLENFQRKIGNLRQWSSAEFRRKITSMSSLYIFKRLCWTLGRSFNRQMQPVIEPPNTEIQIIDIKKMKIAVINGEVRDARLGGSPKWDDGRREIFSTSNCDIISWVMCVVS